MRNTLFVTLTSFIFTVALYEYSGLNDRFAPVNLKVKRVHQSDSYIKLPTVLGRDNASNEIGHRH